MLRNASLVPIAVIVMPACSAGSTMCGSFTAVPPTIAVTNSVSGQPICDATVTVLLGPYYQGADGGDAAAEALMAVASDDGGIDCDYLGGAIDAVGTYTIQVSKPGFQTVVVQDVQVRSDSCADEQPGPSSQQVVVRLVPD